MSKKTTDKTKKIRIVLSEEQPRDMIKREKPEAREADWADRRHVMFATSA